MTTSKRRYQTPLPVDFHSSLKETLAALPSEQAYLRDRLQRIEAQGGIRPSSDMGCHTDWESIREIAFKGQAIGMAPSEVERAQHLLVLAESNSEIAAILKRWEGIDHDRK